MSIQRLKINCGSLGSLMGNAKGYEPPTDKQWKDFFNFISKEKEKLTELQKLHLKDVVHKQISYDPDKISETIRKEIIKIYAYEEYGMSPINAGGNRPYSLDKGNLAEPESIKLLSRIDGIEYKKNELLFSNRIFKGIPDIIDAKKKKSVTMVKDLKNSYDLITFLSLVGEPPNNHDVWQMQGYMDIFNLETSEIVYCLVNMPPQMAEAEKDRVILRCRQLEIPEVEIEERIAAINLSMNYDHIPEPMRIIRHTVARNELRIKDATRRAKLVKQWLKTLDANFKKSLPLEEILADQ